MLFLFVIISTGILATLTMTAFSYGLSFFTHTNLREPQLINLLIKKLPFQPLKIGREHVLGWVIHILIGIFFVLFFKLGIHLLHFSTTPITGVLFGLCIGVLGIVGWEIGFSFHPNPPKINRLVYYLHLLLAHVVFGSTVVFLINKGV